MPRIDIFLKGKTLIWVCLGHYVTRITIWMNIWLLLWLHTQHHVLWGHLEITIHIKTRHKTILMLQMTSYIGRRHRQSLRKELRGLPVVLILYLGRVQSETLWWRRKVRAWNFFSLFLHLDDLHIPCLMRKLKIANTFSITNPSWKIKNKM